MATGPRLMAGWIFPKPAKSWNHIQSQSFILRSLAGGTEGGLTRLGYGKWQACNHSRSFGKTGEIFFRQAFPDTLTICRKKGNKAFSIISKQWPGADEEGSLSQFVAHSAIRQTIRDFWSSGGNDDHQMDPSDDQRWWIRPKTATSCTGLKGPFNLKWWIRRPPITSLQIWLNFPHLELWQSVDFNLIAKAFLPFVEIKSEWRQLATDQSTCFRAKWPQTVDGGSPLDPHLDWKYKSWTYIWYSIQILDCKYKL